MLISGLWHGAAWNFLVWGAIHALFSSVERATNWPLKLEKNNLTKTIAWFLVSIQVLVAWIFFRAESIEQALGIVKIMFSFTGEINMGWETNGSIFILLMIGRELLHATKVDQQFRSVKPVYEMLFYAIVITTIIFFRGEGSEFIYFQF